MKISVIIPMFNEEENVLRTLAKITNVIKEYDDYEILVVDDGSLDDTFKFAKEFELKNHHVNVLKHSVNMGRGKALRTGFENAKGDIMVTIDADLSYDANDIPRLINEFKDETIDIVVGSQYMDGGNTENIPFFRLALSKIANKIVGYAMTGNLSTVTGVFRAYRKHVFDSLELKSDDKEIHLEILSKASAVGLKIKEVSVVLKSRKFGNSKMRIKATTISHLLFTFYEKPMILFGIIGLFLCLIGIICAFYLFYEYLIRTLNPTRPLMMFMLLTLLAGIQILIFGFVATQISLLKSEIYVIQKENKLIRKKFEETND